jgi:hypothetical protein
MALRDAVAISALAAALCVTSTGAFAFDDAAYPDLKGQWNRSGSPRFDPGRPDGRDQQAPFTAEYQAIFEAGLKDVAAGGHGTDPTYVCLSPGMPRIMNVYDPMEILITPATTHILIQHIHDSRRIFTDGRAWPNTIAPTFVGYSIGKWIDTDGDGRFDVLEVETRGLKGPRSFDPAGLPLAFDNKSIFKERFFSDKADPNVLYDEITTIDSALTRPWTVTKKYARLPNRQLEWTEEVCAEGNSDIEIGGQSYFRSADGFLMPTKKDQAPPDLRRFKP